MTEARADIRYVTEAGQLTVPGLLLFRDMLAEIAAVRDDVTELQGRTGWGSYVHTGAAQAISAGVKVTLVNDKGTVLEGQLPADVATFYDGATILGREGDGVAIGVELTFTPSSGAASAFEVSIDIGGSIGELYTQEYAILKGGGVPHEVAYSITAYMLDTWVANGGSVKVVCDGAGEITGVRYVIQRLHKARP